MRSLQISMAIMLVLATSSTLKSQPSICPLPSTTQPTGKVTGQIPCSADCCVFLSQERHPMRQRSAKAKPLQSEWQAATYRGLIIGKSTRADMFRIFGKPKLIDTPADQVEDEPNPEVWYEYERGGEFLGEPTFVVDKRSGMILRIDLYTRDLSKEEAIKHFGCDYIVTKYSFDDCLGNEESAPLYESPNGSITEIEYRARGIAISVDNNGSVKQISYVSKPLGATSSKCSH